MAIEAAHTASPGLLECTPDVVHVVPHQWSYSVQQIITAAAAADNIGTSQPSLDESHYVMAVSGVHCIASPNQSIQSVSDVLSIRTHQLLAIHSMRYGREAVQGTKGHQNDVTRKMVQAVVKFELLSADLNSFVKMELPSSSSSSDDSGTRLGGSFVMYNYARVATLLVQFQKNVDAEEYLPLPPVEDIDFSLLSDKEEWHLLRLYVLLYPKLLEEATTFRHTRGINISVPLKKICLFLTSLSHAFSSYYSRTKILLAPEDHLMPLIHARVHLMTAVQQVMKNALSLLGIEPIDHL